MGEMKLPKFPNEVNMPKDLMPDLVVLRDAALKANNFDFALHLSHVHAWLYWANEVIELNKNHG